MGEASVDRYPVVRPTASVKSSRKSKGQSRPLYQPNIARDLAANDEWIVCPRTGLRIAYLGPRGSFSHLAATRQFGESVEHVDVRSIGNVFSEVATSHCDYGMVPYENSSGGSISDTLDAFLEHDVTGTPKSKSKFDIRCTLKANPMRFAKVSKPQVFDQRRWLRTHLPCRVGTGV